MSEGKGWRGIGPNAGKFVPEADAFKYACREVGILAYDSSAPDFEEFKAMLVGWYFSGNWTEVSENHEDFSSL